MSQTSSRSSIGARFTQVLFEWIPVGGWQIDVGFLADPLSITMCLFITGVGTLIHLYSVGYMHGDENFSKFFVYLNLFAFSMLMLVLVAFVSLILGMGLPTTANYIVVSSLMAPVIVSVGAQSGLIVPIIAVHFFVFYFGVLADVYFVAARTDPEVKGSRGHRLRGQPRVQGRRRGHDRRSRDAARHRRALWPAARRTDCRGAAVALSAAAQCPAMVMRSSSTEPVRTLASGSTSLPTATTFLNISARLPAIVSSSTG
jgi:hypothetical protein